MQGGHWGCVVGFAGMSREGWYVRRGGQVKGPFPASVIARYRARGKLQDADEISPDLQAWRPLGELRKHPAPAVASGSQPTDTPDSAREPPLPAPVAPRSRYVQGLLSQRTNRWLQAGVVAVLLAAILFTSLALRSGDRIEAADCNAAPAPGVNWSSCAKDGARLGGLDLPGARMRATRLRGADLVGANLSGADLAYADLVDGKLAYANLQGASLKGAALAGADLSNADLRDADLSYGDFSRARIGGARFDAALLDNAIWLDGRICAAGSVGRCR